MSRRTPVYQPLRDRERTEESDTRVPRVRLTTRVTLAAYDAITEIQRRHRKGTGKALRLWEVLSDAVVDYAERKGIRVDEQTRH